jgi:F0F1-type ATP synthase alpha subunit
MAIKPEEITSVLRNEIRAFETELKLQTVGYVIQAGDGVARVYGLKDAMAGELIEFPHGVFGMALNLRRTASAASFWATTGSSRRGTRPAARDASSRCRWARRWSAAS